MLNDTVVSIIRTFVPAAVGAVITFLAANGIDVDAEAFEAVLFPVVTGVYYIAARALAEAFPAAGWLLGYPAAPSYDGKITE